MSPISISARAPLWVCLGSCAGGARLLCRKREMGGAQSPLKRAERWEDGEMGHGMG